MKPQDEARAGERVRQRSVDVHTGRLVGYRRSRPTKRRTSVRAMRTLRRMGYTYQEIGEMAGVSKQRAHQLLKPENYR